VGRGPSSKSPAADFDTFLVRKSDRPDFGPPHRRGSAHEGGGFCDSGFIQPVDFFGTGPRIPMIAVSPFSTGGHVVHSYTEH
jgi:phospholipase C